MHEKRQLSYRAVVSLSIDVAIWKMIVTYCWVCWLMHFAPGSIHDSHASAVSYRVEYVG